MHSNFIVAQAHMPLTSMEIESAVYFFNLMQKCTSIEKNVNDPRIRQSHVTIWSNSLVYRALSPRVSSRWTRGSSPPRGRIGGAWYTDAVQLAHTISHTSGPYPSFSLFSGPRSFHNRSHSFSFCYTTNPSQNSSQPWKFLLFLEQ